MNTSVDRRRRALTRALGLTAAAAPLGLIGTALAQSRVPAFPVGRLPALGGATAWLNSPPLTPAGLRGKVVLVNFWTYSCINWLRTLPYVRAWAEKYRDQGLVVIGVHTPEFEFEHDVANVRHAAAAMNVGYPVALDNDYAVWRAFNNNSWPASYLVDAGGKVRYFRSGEGEYEQAERMIQQLLAEANNTTASQQPTAVEGRGAEAAPDWNNLRSGENYVGFERTERFASPGGVAAGRRRVYALPAKLQLNEWALLGEWTIGKQATVLHQADGAIVYRFHARDLHLVMGPAPKGQPVRFRVSIDGQPPGAARGGDVDEQGNGTVREPRLYQLIRQGATPIAERRFEITFLDPGVSAFSFTFG